MVKKTMKLITSFMISSVLTASLFTPAWADAESLAEEPVPEVTESTAEEAADEAFAYYPWLNSNLLGLVDENTTALESDDFYLAVNHDWIANAEFLQGYPFASNFVSLTDQNNQKLMALMTDSSLTSHDAELLQNAYSLFLDWDTRNELGFEPLMPHIEAIEAISSLDELTDYLVSEEGLYHGAALWSLTLGYDTTDSSRYDLEILSCGLSLQDSAEYSQRTPNGELSKQANDQAAMWMLKKAGYTEEEAQDFIDKSYHFEEMMAASIMTYAQQSSPEAVQAMINPVTFEELEETCTAYPLPEILTALDCADWELINLNEPAWLEAMNGLYTEENLEYMKAYTLVNYISSYTSLTDEETFREMQRISRERTGAADSFPDEMTAYSFAGSALPTSLSKVFVEKYMTPEIRDDVTNLINDVVDTYREMLTEEDWLSEETREKAIEKLDHLTINAAYPDKWEDTDAIAFNGAEDGGTLFEMEEALQRHGLDEIAEKKNGRVDPEIWPFGVTDVNAYYNPQNNSINIIAGILGEPFYSPDMSFEEKLGGIGSVIGHEISHAFDTSGAQFDASGNLVNWWTEEDYAAFTARAQKLIEYYDGIKPLEGMPYSGGMVQGEAIADMGGVKCMLRIAEKTGDFDYEAFFRAYARLWASVYTPEMEQQRIAVDNHPLDYLRVNVTCMQYPEFQETFGIKEGDGMYLAPEDRICVW